MLPVRIAGVLGPLPGCQSEGGTFLEYLKGGAVGGWRSVPALFPRMPRTPQRNGLAPWPTAQTGFQPRCLNGGDSALAGWNGRFPELLGHSQSFSTAGEIVGGLLQSRRYWAALQAAGTRQSKRQGAEEVLKVQPDRVLPQGHCGVLALLSRSSRIQGHGLVYLFGVHQGSSLRP